MSPTVDDLKLERDGKLEYDPALVRKREKEARLAAAGALEYEVVIEEEVRSVRKVKYRVKAGSEEEAAEKAGCGEGEEVYLGDLEDSHVRYSDTLSVERIA